MTIHDGDLSLSFFLKDGTGGLDDQDGSSVYDVDTLW